MNVTPVQTSKKLMNYYYHFENLHSLGNRVVSPEEEKEGCGGKDLQKKKVLSLE